MSNPDPVVNAKRPIDMGLWAPGVVAYLCALIEKRTYALAPGQRLLVTTQLPSGKPVVVQHIQPVTLTLISIIGIDSLTKQTCEAVIHMDRIALLFEVVSNDAEAESRIGFHDPSDELTSP